MDGHKAAMTANFIASNLFAQVDQYRQRFLLFDEIIDHRTDGTQINRRMHSSIYPMVTKGEEKQPEDGRYVFNGKTEAQPGTPSRMLKRRIPFSWQSMQPRVNCQRNPHLPGGSSMY